MSSRRENSYICVWNHPAIHYFNHKWFNCLMIHIVWEQSTCFAKVSSTHTCRSPTLSHFFRYCIHEKFKIFNKEKLVSIQRRRIYTEDKAKVVDAILRQYEWCKSPYIFFKSSWCKIASATRNWSNSVSQEAATTFAISSAYILLQYCIVYIPICRKTLSQSASS